MMRQLTNEIFDDVAVLLMDEKCQERFMLPSDTDDACDILFRLSMLPVAEQVMLSICSVSTLTDLYYELHKVALRIKSLQVAKIASGIEKGENANEYADECEISLLLIDAYRDGHYDLVSHYTNAQTLNIVKAAIENNIAQLRQLLNCKSNTEFILPATAFTDDLNTIKIILRLSSHRRRLQECEVLYRKNCARELVETYYPNFFIERLDRQMRAFAQCGQVDKLQEFIMNGYYPTDFDYFVQVAANFGSVDVLALYKKLLKPKHLPTLFFAPGHQMKRFVLDNFKFDFCKSYDQTDEILTSAELQTIITLVDQAQGMQLVKIHLRKLDKYQIEFPPEFID